MAIHTGDMLTGKELWDLYRRKLAENGLDSDTWEECEKWHQKVWIALANELLIWKDST